MNNEVILEELNACIVDHKSFGKGEVIQIFRVASDIRVEIDFNGVKKQLGLRWCVEKNI